MRWQIDRDATEAAAEVFHSHEPIVMRYDRHYLLDHTPYGKLGLLSFGPVYLVAAENRPWSEADSRPLSEATLRHLERFNLRLWTSLPRDSLPQMLRMLAEAEAGANRTFGGLSPYLCSMGGRAEVIGEQGQEVCEQLTALLGAWGPEDPLPAITGPSGVGKCTLIANAAGQLGIEAAELPWGRLTVDRILPTSFEVFLELVLDLAHKMTEDDLLVIANAELMLLLSAPGREQVLCELSRLPHVLLSSQSNEIHTVGIAALPCAGLADLNQARQLLESECPQVDLEGPALDMLSRAASVNGVGIIPLRLVSLVRVGRWLLESNGDSTTLLPDDAAAAIGLISRAWNCN